MPGECMELRDGFSNPDGTPNTQLPGCHMRFTFEATATGSRFVSVSTFPSVEAMEQVLAMGMLEGLRAAMGQIDEVLLSDPQEDPSQLEILDDTHARVTRVVRGSIDRVWRAHHEKERLQSWLLGPDGWTMPVCEVAKSPSDTYRYEWEQADGVGRFGLTGELLESEAPRRALTTERLIGADGPATTHELTLAPRPGGKTQISVRITYPSREIRDAVLRTGMVAGMEASYARLERLLAAD